MGWNEDQGEWNTENELKPTAGKELDILISLAIQGVVGLVGLGVNALANAGKNSKGKNSGNRRNNSKRKNRR